MPTSEPKPGRRSLVKRLPAAGYKGVSTVRAPTQKLAAFDRLASMIVELELLPGARLIEAELAETLNVSKTPIREALLLLESENLVTITPYQGASITWLTLEEYREVHFLLDALEIPALPMVIERISKEDLTVTRRLLDQAIRARAVGDSMLFGELTTSIHTRLFSAGRSPRLARIISGLVGRPGRRYARVFQHQFADTWDIELEIITARFEGIVNRDIEAAARAMSEGHARLYELAAQRIDHPVIKPYVLAPEPIPDVEVIPIRPGGRRSRRPQSARSRD
ncbi:MAG: GntR family transcriptional regulator [Devosia sp.]|nr:GntR family transcriptional regulator [Devosia sp.]